MSIKLYMDHHVDIAITSGLRRRGVDVLTCQDDGTTTWDDDRLLDRATQLGRVLFSQDDDGFRKRSRTVRTSSGRCWTCRVDSSRTTVIGTRYRRV